MIELIFAGIALVTFAVLGLRQRASNKRDVMQMSDSDLTEAIEWALAEGASSSPYYDERARRAAIKTRLEIHQ